MSSIETVLDVGTEDLTTDDITIEKAKLPKGTK